MPAPDPRDLHPPRKTGAPPWLLIFLALALAGAAAWWFKGRKPEPPAPAPEPVAAQPAPAVEPPTAVASGPQHPIEAVPPTPLPDLADADAHVTQALTDLLGRGPVQALLQTDGFVRRVVATVDNLPRASATARLWPVQPTPQRFLVQGEGEAAVIAQGNAGRYGPLLSFAEAVPMERAVQLYAALYPLFQQAYAELGYPKGYFNDRLVAVLDHLLQAPEPQGPLRVQLTEVKGEIADPRPWVRYEFADPELQALSSGQKMLVRMGPANQKRAKKLLAELRRHVASGAVARK
ncbi:DUF3014 domain-containing protein [Pseudorhodoferax sp. Leaf267]|uniref:DUF3014 domain-containing protein n=1 Tax=Pseudorhodoferax sp. Leaf267 TaxID=1736316 RepID=UPI0006FE0F1A|nr:DUF3014 domain-containing protein [Pseudorhodoferax sp. Leaf267]KQP12536.1 hypothetical protein ASF43_19990 [Pseudorhodoferax sp. Leaf267]